MSVSPQLILVTPEACHHDLHVQLVSEAKRDKVHPLPSLDNLLNYRLGFENFNKRCFALVNTSQDGSRDIDAVIYTHASSVDQTEKSWQMLPGQVNRILHERSRPLDAPANVITFYSISSFGKGAGVELIKSLHRTFTDVANPPILTTLSPMRDFGSWIKTCGRDTSLENLRALASEYLGLKQDGVQKFHQNNGAIIGAIHEGANLRGTKDDIDGLGFMVSYRYPRNPEHLEINRYQFKNGHPAPAASHLRHVFFGS